MKQNNGSTQSEKPKKFSKEEKYYYSLPLFFEENSLYPKTASLIFGKLPIKIPPSHFIPLKQTSKETGILIGHKSTDLSSEESEEKSIQSPHGEESSSMDSEVDYTICSRERYPVNLIIDLTEFDSYDDQYDENFTTPPGFPKEPKVSSTPLGETLPFEMDEEVNNEKNGGDNVFSSSNLPDGDKPIIVNATYSSENHNMEGKETFSYFPIEDGGVPSNMDAFVKFLDYIDTCLFEGASIYLHCRNGRGRSGTVVACLLKYCFRVNTETALDIINAAHRSGHGNTKK
jgi:protein-tyrosine phosphatase